MCCIIVTVNLKMYTLRWLTAEHSRSHDATYAAWNKNGALKGPRLRDRLQECVALA